MTTFIKLNKRSAYFTNVSISSKAAHASKESKKKPQEQSGAQDFGCFDSFERLGAGSKSNVSLAKLGSVGSKFGSQVDGLNADGFLDLGLGVLGKDGDSFNNASRGKGISDRPQQKVGTVDDLGREYSETMQDLLANHGPKPAHRDGTEPNIPRFGVDSRLAAEPDTVDLIEACAWGGAEGAVTGAKFAGPWGTIPGALLGCSAGMVAGIIRNEYKNEIRKTTQKDEHQKPEAKEEKKTNENNKTSPKQNPKPEPTKTADVCEPPITPPRYVRLRATKTPNPMGPDHN